MGRFIKVELSDKQRVALEKGYRHDSRHAFRIRCQMVLRKSEGRKSRKIDEVLGCCEAAINNWLKREKQAGVSI